MRTWVKLYTEINHDPKIGTLGWAHRGVWCALLALAGEIDDTDGEGKITGAVDTIPNTAWRLRCEEDELRAALAEFEPRGMTHMADDMIVVSNYPFRQEHSPSTRNEAVAQRVRRHRERAVPCNEDVTALHDECNESVTCLDKIRLDKIREEGARVTRADAPAAQAAPPEDLPFSDPPEPKPEKPTPTRKTRAPRSEAVIALHEITGAWANRAQIDLVDRIVPPDDVPRWKDVVTAWRERGYKPTNVPGMLEWYQGGIPSTRAPVNGNGKGRPEVKDAAYWAQVAEEQYRDGHTDEATAVVQTG